MTGALALGKVEMITSGFAIFAVTFLVLALILVFLGVKVVPQGREFTVERFGRYTKTLRPGLHLIIPVVDRIGRRLNVMEQVLDVPTQKLLPATMQWSASMGWYFTRF